MNEKSFLPENNKNETKEGVPKSFEVLSSEELRGLIIDDEFNFKDKRFVNGSFKYFDIEDTDFQINGSENIWPVIKDNNGEVVGICKITKHNGNSWEDENLRHMYFLSVDPKFQGQGYASRLVENLFKFLKENNLKLAMSSYTSEDSWKKLKPLFDGYSKEYNVELFENDKKMGWK